MTTFTVWEFDGPGGAERMMKVLQESEADGLVKVDDHAAVSWPTGASQPNTKHGHDETWKGAGWGGVWGLVIGALFFMPVVGGLAGAAIGAISKATEDAGITKDQLESIRTEVTEGTSALFLVTEQGDLDRLGGRVPGMHNKLTPPNPPEAERATLCETLGGR